MTSNNCPLFKSLQEDSKELEQEQEKETTAMQVCISLAVNKDMIHHFNQVANVIQLF